MKPALKIAVLLFASISAGCSSGPDEYLFQGGTMGTTWSVKVVGDESVDQSEIQSGVQAVLDDINAKMSNWDNASEISRFNASSSGCTPVSAETAKVVQISQELSRLSDGVFDATLGPLIELWGFGAEFTADEMPKLEDIEGLFEQIGYQKLHLNGNQLCKDTDSLFVNLSATAKGYGVDQVAEFLEINGFDRYLVEVGGELRARGLNRNEELWRIGIEAPLDNVISGQVQELVKLENRALATSGDYRNYFMQDGVRYSHIINPTTGYPVPQEIASVTVLHKSAAWADGWATTLLASGADKGLQLAEQNGISAYFVLRTDDGFEITTSSGWQSAP